MWKTGSSSSRDGGDAERQSDQVEIARMDPMNRGLLAAVAGRRGLVGLGCLED